MTEIGIKQAHDRLLHFPRVGWKTGGAMALGTALVAMCARIAVPLGFTPVPITLQTFAVLLLGLLLEPAAAFMCMVLYLAEALAGMPVLSPHGPGGIAQLLGPTGGYLLAYPVAAALASVLYRRANRQFWAALGSAALASLVILVAGAAWLGVLSHAHLSAVFALSVAPFLPGDAVKVFAAAACAGILGSFGEAAPGQTL